MKLIKIFDYFGIEISLSYKQNDKYYTYFGLLITFSIVLLGIISFIYFSEDMRKHKNPKALEYTIKNNFSYVNFNDNNLYFAFGIYSSKKKVEFINETIYNFKAQLYTVNRTLNYSNPAIKYIDLELEKCSTNSIPNNKFVDNYMRSIPLENLICFSKKDYEKLFVQGNFDDEYFQGIKIVFNRCENETNSNLTCESENIIDDWLEDTWIEYYLIDNSVEILNYHSPIKYNSRYEESLFTKNQVHNRHIKFRNGEIDTDEGLIFDDRVKKQFSQISTFKNENNPRVNKNFINIFIGCEYSKKIITRQYDKLLKTIAEVGGILNILFITIKIIFQPFLKIIMIEELVKNNYLIKKPVENDNQTEKKSKVKYIIKYIKSKFQNKIKPIIKNTISDYFLQLNSSFCKIFSIYYCPKRKKITKNNKNLNFAIDDILKNLDINNILKKFHEIDLIKSLIFDDIQLEFINSIEKCVIDDNFSISQLKETGNMNLKISNTLKKIRSKDKKNRIDKNIINHYFFKNSNKKKIFFEEKK